MFKRLFLDLKTNVPVLAENKRLVSLLSTYLPTYHCTVRKVKWFLRKLSKKSNEQFSNFCLMFTSIRASIYYFSNFGKVPRENWIVTYLLTWPIFRPLKSFCSTKSSSFCRFQQAWPYVYGWFFEILADSSKFWRVEKNQPEFCRICQWSIISRRLVKNTDYGRSVRKSPLLYGRKSTPTPKCLGTTEAYFVCHIGPNFQISLIYTFIGCP